jgi:hypothetical protein
MFPGMEEPNHNPMEYTPDQVADDVDRSAALIRLYCKENKIEHRQIGRIYLISEAGLEQARKLVATSRPGRPKGSKNKKANGRVLA